MASHEPAIDSRQAATTSTRHTQNGAITRILLQSNKTLLPIAPPRTNRKEIITYIVWQTMPRWRKSFMRPFLLEKQTCQLSTSNFVMCFQRQNVMCEVYLYYYLLLFIILSSVNHHSSHLILFFSKLNSYYKDNWKKHNF